MNPHKKHSPEWHLVEDAEALKRLYIRGYLTEKQADILKAKIERKVK